MMQAVVGVEITIEDMVGKAKLSQNQADENRRSLIDALCRCDTPESMAMAGMIGRPPFPG